MHPSFSIPCFSLSIFVNANKTEVMVVARENLQDATFTWMVPSYGKLTSLCINGILIPRGTLHKSQTRRGN